MSHVLILSLVFPPDNVSTAHLMGELSKDLVELGHKVTVLTTVPHFNQDPVAEAEQPIRARWGRLLGKSDYYGATVYHAMIPKKTPNRLKRVAGWLIFHTISTVAGFALPRNVDVIIGPSPPLTIGVGAWLLGLRHRAPFVYNVQELYPDLAVDMGIIDNTMLVTGLRYMEHFVYARAESVTAITPHVRQKLLDRGVPAEKAIFLPNWVDTEEIQPRPRRNEFAERHGLLESFVVSYAGNMGLAQNLDYLIAVASEMKTDLEVRFLLVGDGVDRVRLERTILDLGLRNVVMLSHQPYSEVPLIYASSDLSYVGLLPGLDSDALPSKVYRIMASGRAVLAVTNRGSALAQLVEEADCGFVVEPRSPGRLAGVIRAAARDKELVAAKGRAGRDYVEQNYSRKLMVGRYAELVERLSTENRRARK